MNSRELIEVKSKYFPDSDHVLTMDVTGINPVYISAGILCYDNKYIFQVTLSYDEEPEIITWDIPDFINPWQTPTIRVEFGVFTVIFNKKKVDRFVKLTVLS